MASSTRMTVQTSRPATISLQVRPAGFIDVSISRTNVRERYSQSPGESTVLFAGQIVRIPKILDSRILDSRIDFRILFYSRILDSRIDFRSLHRKRFSFSHFARENFRRKQTFYSCENLFHA